MIRRRHRRRWQPAFAWSALSVCLAVTAVAAGVEHPTGKCAESPSAWRETAEGPLEAPYAGEAVRIIWRDYRDVFWWVLTLRLSPEGGSLETRVVSNLPGESPPARTVALDRVTSLRLRRLIWERGFWERRLELPDRFGGRRFVWGHISIEGAERGRSVCYTGLEAQDLAVFEPLLQQMRDLAGGASR